MTPEQVTDEMACVAIAQYKKAINAHPVASEHYASRADVADKIRREAMKAAIAAAIAASGCVLVPREPPVKMLEAAYAADKEYCSRMGMDASVSVGPYDHYIVMLAAAEADQASG